MVTQVLHLIPDTAARRYTAAPTPSTVTAAKTLQEAIRDVLGSDYETFLQGSYKNDTGVPDLNDVDVVALRKTYYSTHFTGRVATNPVSWDTIFQEVHDRLEASYHYCGKTERGDKCIKVNTNFKADVIPAIRIGHLEDDPIAVYSFREGSERKNYPRDHYERNVDKQADTADNYKPTVRMFKRWIRNWFAGTDVAPSFYVECLIHSVRDNLFTSDPPATFLLVADHIVNKLTRNSVIMSVAGDKDILTDAEWVPTKFETFQAQLSRSLSLVSQAFNATSAWQAERLWREAFNE
jgi:hypothetical protein